ncbi:hypothetical protein EDB85DRAFT_1889662 [Lactarius pseudohatsudake]|nr:hypothetical protein EDB85DRAFT_1889662 [Lactarius pseudohatsudake]
MHAVAGWLVGSCMVLWGAVGVISWRQGLARCQCRGVGSGGVLHGVVGHCKGDWQAAGLLRTASGREGGRWQGLAWFWGGVLRGLAQGVGVEQRCGILRAMGQRVGEGMNGAKTELQQFKPSSSSATGWPTGGLRGGNCVEKKWLVVSSSATSPQHCMQDPAAMLLQQLNIASKTPPSPLPSTATPPRHHAQDPTTANSPPWMQDPANPRRRYMACKASPPQHSRKTPPTCHAASTRCSRPHHHRPSHHSDKAHHRQPTSMPPPHGMQDPTPHHPNTACNSYIS